MSIVNYQPAEVEEILCLVAALTGKSDAGRQLIRGIRSMFGGVDAIVGIAEIRRSQICRVELLAGESDAAANALLLRHATGALGSSPRLTVAEDGSVLVSYGKPTGSLCSVIALRIDKGPATLKTATSLHMLHAFADHSLLSSRPTPTDDRRFDLAPRVRDVLAGLLDGLCEKEVAERLGLSRHTVHVYVKAVYKHFEVKSRAELLVQLFTAERSVAFRSGTIEANQVPLSKLYPSDQIIAASDPVPSVTGPKPDVRFRQLKTTSQRLETLAVVPSPRKPRSYSRIHARPLNDGGTRR